MRVAVRQSHDVHRGIVAHRCLFMPMSIWRKLYKRHWEELHWPKYVALTRYLLKYYIDLLCYNIPNFTMAPAFNNFG